MTKSAIRIPVARPLLPTRAAIAPYLDEIDVARWYTNFGPLCLRFEARLADRYGLSPECVCTVSNATVGLVVSLQAAGAAPGSHCLVPSWTFSASVHAVIAAGLVPLFVDVDEGGALTPEIARGAFAGPQTIGAVMPVAVYGQTLDAAGWAAFSAAHGVPVILDAATAFDSAQPGPCPSVVSLHATKILGVGEGGFVMSHDPGLIADIRRRINFGFSGNRETLVEATNGKMSEYAAAVGLAALDGWDSRRAGFQRLASRYRAGLARLAGAKLVDGFGEDWLAATCVVELDRPAQAVAADLANAGVETRAWWGMGMHRQPAFSHFPRRPLPVTETLALRTLGLPMYLDMPDEAVDYTIAALEKALTSGR